MTEPKLFIPVLLGTPRKKRESQNVAEWVCSQMRAPGHRDAAF